MINYAETKSGDKLQITGMGAPGFAELDDTVTVKSCTSDNHGECIVINDKTGEEVSFVLTCGAERLKPLNEESTS